MNARRWQTVLSWNSARWYLLTLVVLTVAIGLGCTLPDFLSAIAGFPVPEIGATVSPSSGPTAGGTKVTITGKDFPSNGAVLFGGFLGEQTQVVSDTIVTSVSPAQAAGKVDITIVAPGVDAIKLTQAFEYVEGVADDGQAPRVVGATSVDNNTVLVTFSKPMGAGVETTSSYQITGTDTAFLVVTKAKLMADKTSVALTTLTQDFDLYTVHVVGVKDVFGHELATPDRIDAGRRGDDPIGRG